MENMGDTAELKISQKTCDSLKRIARQYRICPLPMEHIRYHYSKESKFPDPMAIICPVCLLPSGVHGTIEVIQLHCFVGACAKYYHKTFEDLVDSIPWFLEHYPNHPDVLKLKSLALKAIRSLKKRYTGTNLHQSNPR